MSEVKPGMPEQYHPINMPTAPVNKPAEGAPVNNETTERASMQDDISKKKSFQELQLEAYNKLQQQKMWGQCECEWLSTNQNGRKP